MKSRMIPILISVIGIMSFGVPIFVFASAHYDYIADTISRNCRGYDLILGEHALLEIIGGSAEGPNRVNAKFRKLTDDERILQWPNYDKEFIRERIRMFATREPYGEFIGQGSNKRLVNITPQFTTEDGTEISNDGRTMLSCGDNILDISGRAYFWNDQVIESPRHQWTIFGFSLFSFGGLTLVALSIIGILGITIRSLRKRR